MFSLVLVNIWMDCFLFSFLINGFDLWAVETLRKLLLFFFVKDSFFFLGLFYMVMAESA